LKLRLGIVEHIFDVPNNIKIMDLKEMFANAENKKKGKEPLDVTLIRLFYSGKECKDDLFVYSYDMAEGMTLTVMIRPRRVD
jgi:hypothetical protein